MRLAEPRDVAIHAPAASTLYVRGTAGATGGAELQATLLARALADRGLRVCHVVEEIGGLPTQSEGVDLVVQPPRAESRNRLHTVQRTVAAIRRADARVYIQRSAGMPTGLVATYARTHGRRFIFSASSSTDVNLTTPLGRAEQVSYRAGLRLADEIVVQTREQAELAHQSLHREVTWIPSFCEVADPSDSVRDMFLWIGRPAIYKDPLAFVALAAAVPEARFMMVGIDPAAGAEDPGGDVARLARDMSNLELLGSRPRSDVLPLYDRAVAVVNTSMYEGLPNTFLEAWARGVPALSLRVNPSELISKHGLGAYVSGSPAALAAETRGRWRQRDSPSDDGARALDYVRANHEIGVVADRWVEVIERCAERQLRPSKTAR